MLRIPNQQNTLPELYLTEFSIQKIPTVNSYTVSSQKYTGFLLS